MATKADDVPVALAGSIQNLLDQQTLKWIFVGGKGGVGKTTCSCSLAIQFSKVRERVLLVSTDPAHNLSDAFNQQFGKEPTLVNGFANLYAMEIDPSSRMPSLEGLESSGFGVEILKDLLPNIPGVDEAQSFLEMMQYVQSSEFSITIFDTAPTGHTLRLLSLPDVVQKLLALKSKFMPMISSMAGMMGVSQDTISAMANNESFQERAKLVLDMFHDHERTTFVCVCIAEFLSLYETERLIQELVRMDIDVRNIIVNQLLNPDPAAVHPCEMCIPRAASQRKYLQEIDDLYVDFHVVKVPLQKEEVRGPQKLEKFSNLLRVPSL